MASQIPAQPAAEWYAAEPLYGSGRDGSFVEDDFLKALQISKEQYQDMRNACIRLLDGYADDENTRIDLRTLWNGRSGTQTKRRMINELITDFNMVFVNTTRFNPPPSNWTRISWALIEKFFGVANTRRSRVLLAGKPRAASPSTPSTADPGASDAENVPSTPIPSLRQSSQSLPPQDRISFASTGAFTLNNVTIPVVFNGETEDIAAWMIRPDDQIETLQYYRDVSLDKFKQVIGMQFMIEETVEIYTPNSAGEYRLVQSDLHLQASITRWMGIYTRNNAPPPNFFLVHLSTENAQRGMYQTHMHLTSTNST